MATRELVSVLCRGHARTTELTALLAFFLANEYLRAHGHPGLLDGCTDYESLVHVADRHINAAAGLLDVQGLVHSTSDRAHNP